MLSMKQAASRPRPPFPSAGVRLDAAQASRSTPSSASARAPSAIRPRIAERVEQEPPDQELQGEVIDALLPALVGGAGRVHPAVDDVVAHGEGRRREPVVVARAVRVLAHRIGQLGEDRLLEGGDVRLARACLRRPSEPRRGPAGTASSSSMTAFSECGSATESRLCRGMRTILSVRRTKTRGAIPLRHGP